MTAGGRPRRLAGQEVEREARRLFPRLLGDQGYLAGSPNGDDCVGEGVFELFTRKNGFFLSSGSIS